MRKFIFTIILSAFLGEYSFAQTAIAIPDTLSGSTMSLTMHLDSVQFFPGIKTKTLGFNQYSYLGPTLILQNGQNASMQIHNQINDTTNVHWHGMHVASNEHL